MVESILAILSSSGLGAIVGGIFGLFTKSEDRKIKAEENDHDFRMAQLSLQELTIVNQHQVTLEDKKLQQSKVEGELEVEKEEAKAFAGSVKESFKKIGIGFVDSIRFLIRPLVTVYLLAISSVLAYRVFSLVSGLESLPVEDILALYKYVIAQVFFLTTTAVTWWFSSRKQGNQLSLK